MSNKSKDIYCGPECLAKIAGEVAINHTPEKGWVVQIGTLAGIFEGHHNTLLNAACGEALKAWKSQARVQHSLLEKALKEAEKL